MGNVNNYEQIRLNWNRVINESHMSLIGVLNEPYTSRERIVNVSLTIHIWQLSLLKSVNNLNKVFVIFLRKFLTTKQPASNSYVFSPSNNLSHLNVVQTEDFAQENSNTIGPSKKLTSAINHLAKLNLN